VPSDPRRFYVWATLSGGAGTGIIKVVDTRSATGSLVAAGEGVITFPDRRKTVSVIHKLDDRLLCQRIVSSGAKPR
jgi:hypothetical protein